MATSSEEWEARKLRREEQRAQQKAKQRKMQILLLSAVAVLVLCGVLIAMVASKSGKSSQDEAVVQTQDVSAQTEQSESSDSSDQAETDQTEQADQTEPTQEDTKTKTIHIAAAGDVNVTDKVVASGGVNYVYTDTFMDVAHLLADADVAVVNLEGNLCGAPYGTNSASAPQGLMDALDKAGVDLVQLANSYSINKGISGLKQTIDGVRAAGMEPLGVYADEAAYKEGKGYTICTVEGIKIAFVAFTKGMDGMALPAGSENSVNLLYTDYESTYQQINREGIAKVLDAASKENPDVVIAMLHWGSEYNDTISTSQEGIVKFLKESGVDAIIGTHPHYVQKMEFDQETGTFVAYSLGDLISDAERSGTQYSVILDLEITKDLRNGNVSITNYSYVPIYTVAEKENPVRVVRIAEAMFAYDCYFLGRVSSETYTDMQYALERVAARISGE